LNQRKRLIRTSLFLLLSQVLILENSEAYDLKWVSKIPGYYNLQYEVGNAIAYEELKSSKEFKTSSILISKPNPGEGIEYSGLRLSLTLDVREKLKIISPQLALAQNSLGEILGFGGTCRNRGVGLNDCTQVINAVTGKEILKVQNDSYIDLHEIIIDGQSNYWVLAYPEMEQKAIQKYSSKIPLYKSQKVIDCEILKLSSSGEILSTFRLSELLPMTEIIKKHFYEFQRTIEADTIFDPFHCNSLAIIDSDNILISLRNTNSLYSLNLKNKTMNWKLGGNHWPGVSLNLRTQGENAKSISDSQHDARYLGNDLYSFFDNQSQSGKPARGVLFKIYKPSSPFRYAKLIETFTDPGAKSSTCQGSFRRVSERYFVAAWGCSLSGVTIFSRNGQAIVSTRISLDKENYKHFPKGFDQAPSDSLLQRLTTVMTYRAVPYNE